MTERRISPFLQLGLPWWRCWRHYHKPSPPPPSSRSSCGAAPTSGRSFLRRPSQVSSCSRTWTTSPPPHAPLPLTWLPPPIRSCSGASSRGWICAPCRVSLRRRPPLPSAHLIWRPEQPQHTDGFPVGRCSASRRSSPWSRMRLRRGPSRQQLSLAEGAGRLFWGNSQCNK
ncbi:hypothetical protein PVAP13_9KG042758 [Panicum virgatum]|uniref:Uncharacterized protein n=1 Tax=Panicum virgatum TaxID=38727 RepID=A0A8T0N9Z5_PANVG|nr:hypothetical protein PVAP13_9KG042758 [Panicum virgatum]